MRYNNYHKHSHYSNLRSLDVICKPEDYMKRAIELNHNTYFTTEHGWAGNAWEALSLCKQYGIKCIYGAEVYYVDNRLEKDRGNYHLIIIALNNNGYKEINKIISEANKTGYYYKPRIDLELLKSLNPKNVIITSACTGSRLFKTNDYEDSFLKPVLNHFKDNFYLEIQSHVAQSEYNKKILALHKQYNIPLIHANDSHYIYPKDSKYRDLFLKAKGIVYEEEDEYILDYPSYDEILERYKKQGVLEECEVIRAIENTLVFDKCEDLKLTDDIKLPKIHKDKNSNQLLKRIIAEEWNKEKTNIPKSKWNEYEEAIRYEIDIVEKTNMEDYFILDYEIVKRAIDRYGGVLTRTGRGSAPSFYINKLLGLTNIDRLYSPITLYPTRFMSTTRILESKSLPDIDLNWGNIEPAIKSSKDILGEDGVYFMIAYKPLQDSSAFRLWCKANDMNISEYNDIAKNIEQYENNEKWGKIIQDSKVFKGVIESVAPSPCSFLLLDKSISEEVCLIKVGDQLCCCLDGYNCDKYKFLKNDLLTVSVWDIIAKTFELIEKPIPTIRELNGLLDDSVWNLYKEGLTATLNQADSDFATPLVKKYSPTSVAEMSAWVAGIRPGFASLLNTFLNRKKYTTGINELDEVLEDSFHFMMYQESIMKYLVWLGIEESETYDIIKKIAKKKFKEKELVELKSKLLNGWLKNVNKEEGFEETWQVVEDAAKYSFNASHSLSVAYDSLYGAYLKANYPLEYYSVVLNMYKNDVEKSAKITDELGYFNIKLLNPKFRYSKSEYMFDKKTNSIYKGISSIKFLNELIGEELYDLRENKYNNFIDLLIDLQNTSINSKQLEILIMLGFFSEFGCRQKLLDCVKLFESIYGKKQIKKGKLNELENIISKYSKQTEKMFKDIDYMKILEEYYNIIEDKEIPIPEIIQAEIDYLGYVSYTDKSFPMNMTIVSSTETNKWGTPFVTLYNIATGKSTQLKVDKKYFNEKPLNAMDLIKVINIEEKHKRKKVDGKWTVSDETELILTQYGMVVQ